MRIEVNMTRANFLQKILQSHPNLQKAYLKVQGVIKIKNKQRRI